MGLTNTLEETFGSNSPPNKLPQPTSAKRTHAHSELWLWQDFGAGGLEGVSRDRSVEQPWTKVSLQHQGLHHTMV
jgi:hypothetical protein